MLIRSYVAVMLTALVGSLLLTPLARRLALAVGAVGRTGGRHVHGQVTPRLGGLAIAGGWSISVLGVWAVGLMPADVIGQYRAEFAAVLIGGLAMCVVGAVDDVRGLPVSRKLIAQCAVAILAYSCGFRIDGVALPLVGTLSMGIFALPVTVLWIIGITNAVNLIDGLDGLAAGVAFFAAFTTFTVAWIGGSPFAAWMAAPLMGVLAGFLVFNFNPARIFMGDSGSYFLGFVLATVSLTGARQQKASTAVSLLVPMIALGLPIFDTLFTMFRRYLERRSLFSPDRGHIHHRLLDLGLTHRRAVMTLYGVCVIFTVCAIGVSFGRAWQAGIALLSVSLVCVALVRFAGYFEYLHRVRRQEARIYDPSTDRLRHVVPLLLQELWSAHGEREIIGVLPTCLAGCSMERIDIETIEGAPVHCVESAPGSGVGREIQRARFPIGREDRARTRISFAWHGDRPEVPAPTAILLQLLVDAVAQRLQTCGSELAPRPIENEEESLPHGLLPLPSSTEGA
jgi:UDP-GlcNAc:undecaprenyl-phosphate GlcNAc-1-phosphate transferase